MAKKTIILGTPNGKDGDIIRDAFKKVNDNFDELYTLTGGTAAELTELAQDYAASMFTGGTHSGIAVNYDDINNKLNLTVSALDLSAITQNIVPATDITYDLGSLTHRFRDLYLSGNTITLGSTTISTTPSGNLKVSGNIVTPNTMVGFSNAVSGTTVSADKKTLTFDPPLQTGWTLEPTLKIGRWYEDPGIPVDVDASFTWNYTPGSTVTSLTLTDGGTYDIEDYILGPTGELDTGFFYVNPNPNEVYTITGIDETNQRFTKLDAFVVDGTAEFTVDTQAQTVTGSATASGTFRGVNYQITFGLKYDSGGIIVDNATTTITVNGGSTLLASEVVNFLYLYWEAGVWELREFSTPYGGVFSPQTDVWFSFDKLQFPPTIPPLFTSGASNGPVNAIGNSTVNGDFTVTGDLTVDGDLYVSPNSLYLGNLKLSTTDNTTLLVNDAPLGGGQGLPSITIPATPVVLYKGLQASYGVVHSNNNPSELNVNKIVIHKPATTTVTIDPTGSNDVFQVSGLGSSDVLAMFVVYGDVNGAKPLSTLQNFTRSVIDNVILVGGEAGVFRTVDQMKTAFYANYATLAAAANGLYTNFQFYEVSVPTMNGGPTTVREGSGTVEFTIFDNGNGTYTIAGVNGGTDYLIGHKIKILGTSVGGATPDNDIIVTVVATNGEVVAAQEYTGVAAGNTFTQYFGVTGTNYNVGSGFTVDSVTNTGINVNSIGFNYVVGDVLTLLGENITGGTTPANNITITVNAVDGLGQAYGYTVSGARPDIWPTNNIGDGGQDQYDTANYINTNLANQIDYNSGNTVVDGTAEFGAGSTYSFVYDTAIFGLFVTGNGATSISTSGNSGADGGSTTETGYMFGGGTAAETFDNAVTHINLIGDPYAGEEVSFTKTDNGSEVDILIADDGAGAGVGITRDGNNGIYNPYREGSWDSDVSPGGTLWNIDGWDDLTDVESRTYASLYETFGFGGLGNKIVGTECVMYLPDNGKYYAVKFSQWTQGNAGGGFAYTRRELDLTSLAEGIRFADGTVLKSAAGIGPVKLESPGNRRIEEVYGYKSVSVTQRQTTNLTTTASRNAADEFRFWIDTTTTTIDDILNNTTAAGIWDTTTIEFSLDNVTWYRYDFNSTGAGNEIGYGVIIPGASLNYSQGDTIYFRYQTGGAPVVWWDRNELPGGATNFRGAIIDYHAYDTGAGTMIGTIHIARDSGDEYITHTEVFSGGSDGENIDIWIQNNEGELKYRRLDGESSTLKVQWSAKVFYGSEFWD